MSGNEWHPPCCFPTTDASEPATPNPLSAGELRQAQVRDRDEAIHEAEITVKQVQGEIHERLSWTATIDGLAKLMDAKIELAALKAKEPGAW